MIHIKTNKQTNLATFPYKKTNDKKKCSHNEPTYNIICFKHNSTYNFINFMSYSNKINN